MPPPAEERAFLPAVLARYRDDGPRLVYADFLDESDAPADRGRAELIRVQIALARLTDDHPRRRELADRQAELLAEFLPRWTDHLAGLIAGCEFRRGLLDAVSVDAGTFLARGDELFRRAPVRRVRLLDAARRMADLVDCPFLAPVRELDLSGTDLGDGGVNVLLRSPHLGRVETLDLSLNGLTDGAARRLVAARTAPRLRHLALTDNGRVGDDGLRALAGSPALAARLRSLDVAGNAVGAAGVRAVVEGRGFHDLHTIRAHANPLGDAGVAALANSPLLGRMLDRDPRLDLRQCGLGPAGGRALAGAAVLAKVTTLDLSDNALGDAGLAAVALSSHPTRLRRLLVRRNQVGDDGAAVLAHSPLMPRLAALDVSANQITVKGMDALYRFRRDWKTDIVADGNFVTACG